MAAKKVTFPDKEDKYPVIDQVRQVSSANMNEIKSAIIDHADKIDSLNENVFPLHIEDNYVGIEKLTQEVRDFVGSQGNMVNYPDNEDIYSTADLIPKLKLKDRSNYKFIRADFDFDAIPVDYSNSIWELRYEYDLHGSAINIPENVVFRFNGGIFKNGTINGNLTKIECGEVQIFGNDIILTGFENTALLIDWFGATKNTGVIARGKNNVAFERAMLFSSTIKLGIGNYETSEPVVILGNSKELSGSGINSTITGFGNINIIEIGDGISNVNNGMLSNISLNAGDITVTRAVYGRNLRQFDFENINISGLSDADRCFSISMFELSFSWRCNITGVYGIYLANDGFILGNGIAGNECNAMVLNGCKLNRVTGLGFNFYGAGQMLYGVSAEACNGGAVNVDYCSGFIISGGYFEANGNTSGWTVNISHTQNSGVISGCFFNFGNYENHKGINISLVNGFSIIGNNFYNISPVGGIAVYTGVSSGGIVAIGNMNEGGTGTMYSGTSFPESFAIVSDVFGTDLYQGVKIGTDGKKIIKHYSEIEYLIPTLIPTVPGYVDAMIVVEGAAAGDTVTVGGVPNQMGMIITAYVAGGNQVNVRFAQLFGEPLIPTEGYYRVDVWKH